MWISNIELKENKKISKDSTIPEGWVTGRNKWNNTQEKVCPICSKKFVVDVTRKRQKYCSKSC